jgi:hypothetical protein
MRLCRLAGVSNPLQLPEERILVRVSGIAFSAWSVVIVE